MIKKKIYFETERLLVRSFILDDLESFLNYRNDPIVAKYQSWKFPITKNEGEKFLQDQLDYGITTKGKWHQLAIEEKSSCMHIGDCAVHLSLDGKQGEIGITIARKFQRNGFGYEVLSNLFQYLFYEIKLHRITALVDAENLPSLNLMGKLGMRKEALFKESYLTGSSWTDEVQFAILEKEYRFN